MKTTTTYRYRTRLIGLLLSFVLVLPAFAANECQVYYSYYNNSGTSQGQTLNLDEGEVKPLGQSKIRYIQNKKDYPVQVEVTNLWGGGKKWVPLNNNGAKDPPTMTEYGGDVTLYNVECGGSAFPGPEDMVNTLKAMGVPVEDIASGLNDTFNQTEAQVAQLLEDANFSATQIAQALQGAFNASGQQVAQWMAQAGIWARYVAVALEEAFDASGDEVAMWLRQAGFSTSQVAQGLIEAFGAGGDDVAEWLLEAGFTPNQVAQALIEKFGADKEQVAQWLAQAGLSLNEVARVLKEGFTMNAATAANFLESMFNASMDAIRAALEFAGYTAMQINQWLASQITIDQTYTGHASFMAPATTPPQNFPFHTGTNQITIVGKGLAVVTSISNLPGRARIVGRGATKSSRGNPSGDFLQVEVDVPTRTRIGSTGRAVLSLGASRGPSFNWVVEAPQQRDPGRRPPAGGGRGAAQADLVPLNVENMLYKVGSATTMDADGDTFTALDPFNNSAFCQGIPQGDTARNRMPTSNTRQITVPDIRWGVENTSSVDVTDAFTIQLLHGRRVVASERVNSLRAGERAEFTFSRRQSQTTVARVGPGAGCYHAGLRREGWNDNDGFTVQVDTNRDVDESRETNNNRAM